MGCCGRDKTLIHSARVHPSIAGLTHGQILSGASASGLSVDEIVEATIRVESPREPKARAGPAALQVTEVGSEAADETSMHHMTGHSAAEEGVTGSSLFEIPPTEAGGLSNVGACEGEHPAMPISIQRELTQSGSGSEQYAVAAVPIGPVSSPSASSDAGSAKAALKLAAAGETAVVTIEGAPSK